MQKTENLKNEAYCPSEKTALTFSALYYEWLKECGSGVKESTYAQYRIYAKNHLLPYFGDSRLEEIRAQDVREFVHFKLNTSKRPELPSYSPSTVRLMLSILKLIVQYACMNGYSCDANLTFPRLQEGHSRRKAVLTVEEQTRLTRVLNESPNIDAVGILLSLYTGLRIGEICALRWNEIDLGSRRIQIKYTLQRVSVFDPQSPRRTKLILSYPKSRKSLRDVPIPLFLMEKLAGVCPEDARAYLLTGSSEIYLEPRTLENRFRKYAMGCELPQVHFHMCRHSFATRCLEKGVDIKTLSEILGHSSVKITLDRYAHSSFDLKLTNVDKLTFLG